MCCVEGAGPERGFELRYTGFVAVAELQRLKWGPATAVHGGTSAVNGHVALKSDEEFTISDE